MGRTLKITLAYDGTRYVGWQRQPNGCPSRRCSKAALAPLEVGTVRVAAPAGPTPASTRSGRSRAAGCGARSSTGSLVRALNARLPADVRVVVRRRGAAGVSRPLLGAREDLRYTS